MGRVANPAHLLHYKKRTFTERQVKVNNIDIDRSNKKFSSSE